MASERRGARRVEISQLISIEMLGERWIHAQGVDLSRTGFKMRASEDLDPGTQLYVQFDMDGEQVAGDAIVVHVVRDEDGTFAAGCEFTGFHGASRSRLESFLQQVD